MGGEDDKVIEPVFEIPTEFKDKPYMKGVDSIEALCKKLDGAETVIGKKISVPNENTSDEDRNKFYSMLGRPEKAEDYIFEENEQANTGDDFLSKIKGVYFKEGTSAVAAKNIQKAYEDIVIEHGRVQNETFNKLVEDTWGDKAQSTLDNANALLKNVLPEEFVPFIDQMDNNSAYVLTAILDKFKEKYVSDDDLKKGDGFNDVPLSNEDIRAEAKALMSEHDPKTKKIMFKDPMHPRHQEIKDKVAALYKQIKS